MLRQRICVWATVVAVLANDLPLQLLNAGDWPWRKPRKSSLEQLAARIDEVQAHLDAYGTIVPKTADVWGQSRLMRHREDFEKQMFGKLDDFEFRLQGAEAVRDSALLSSALAIDAAIRNQPAATTGEETEKATTTTTESTTIAATATSLGPTVADITSSTNNLVPRSGFTAISTEQSSRFLGGGKEGLAVGIEPAIELDQLRRYLDHLNELRRLNEGDDTADSPGYSLNLVRIPVSILPGQETRIGYGAEVTVTMQPHLTDETLPMAFRDFVINDIVDLIGLPVTQMANYKGDKTRKTYREALQKYQRRVLGIKDPDDKDPIKSQSAPPTFLELFDASAQKYHLYDADSMPAGGSDADNSNLIWRSTNEIRRMVEGSARGTSASRRSRLPIADTHLFDVCGHTLAQITVDAATSVAGSDEVTAHLLDVKKFLRTEADAAYNLLSQPTSQCLWQAHCNQELVDAVTEFRRRLPDDVKAAYEKSLETMHLVDDNVRPTLGELRKRFFTDIRHIYPEVDFTTTGALAWLIIVESALLDDHLKKDMRELATTRNCPHVNGDHTCFYGPNPPFEARMAFNEYVRCRWPIHVFTLDPTMQQQNIGTAYSRRRELQLVLAVAAARRAISAECLTRFVRRLEYDLETIDLNNTEVGFTHGDDTFGWRFYPRVQSPPVPGNLQAITQDLLIGDLDKDDLLRERRLEPGMRECTAIVVMPSFVPYVMIDVQSSWFRLADNRHFGRALERRMDRQDSVALGREVVELRRLFNSCTDNARLYRDGDVHRLSRSVDQLERQLALQTSYVQVPHENTLGGFEMFSSGVTDLAPELDGWYGETGILVADPPATVPAGTVPLIPTTAIFLVGRHFTALGDGTRIIAGGIDVTDSRESLSREVMSVNVPANAIVSKDSDGVEYVDVHLATPYGVSSHVHVRAIRRPDPKAAADAVAKHEKQHHVTSYKWEAADLTGCVQDIRLPTFQVEIDQAPVLTVTTSTPFDSGDVDFKAWVAVKPVGAEFQDLKQRTDGARMGIFLSTMQFDDDGKHTVDPADLEKALKAALSQGDYKGAIEAIRLTAFVRGRDGNKHADAEPVFKVANELTIKVSRCDECPPATVKPAEPAPAPAPSQKP